MDGCLCTCLPRGRAPAGHRRPIIVERLPAIDGRLERLPVIVDRLPITVEHRPTSSVGRPGAPAARSTACRPTSTACRPWTADHPRVPSPRPTAGKSRAPAGHRRWIIHGSRARGPSARRPMRSAWSSELLSKGCREVDRLPANVERLEAREAFPRFLRIPLKDILRAVDRQAPNRKSSTNLRLRCEPSPFEGKSRARTTVSIRRSSTPFSSTRTNRRTSPVASGRVLCNSVQIIALYTRTITSRESASDGQAENRSN